jgi:hypothetical protein
VDQGVKVVLGELCELSLALLDEGLEARVFLLEDGNVRITSRILVFEPIDLVF